MISRGDPRRARVRHGELGARAGRDAGWLAQFGPPIALVALLMTARWGAYQGPVVFSVPDVAHLLGAPLPRSGLAARRLRSALAAGAPAGALARRRS